MKSAIVSNAEQDIATGDLYAAFARWAEIGGHDVPSPAAFGRKLTALKFQRVKRGGAIYYVGVELAPRARVRRGDGAGV